MPTSTPTTSQPKSLSRGTTPGLFVLQMVQLLSGLMLLAIGIWYIDPLNIGLGLVFGLPGLPGVWTWIGPEQRKLRQLSDKIQKLSLNAGDPASTALVEVGNLPEDHEDALKLLYKQVQEHGAGALETAEKLVGYADFNVQAAGWSVIGRYGGARQIERVVRVARGHSSLALSKHPVLRALEALQSRHPEMVARATAELQRNDPKPATKPFRRGLKLWAIATVSSTLVATVIGGLYVLLGSDAVSMEMLLLGPMLVLMCSVAAVMPMVLIGSASVKAAQTIDNRLKRIKSGTATYSEGQIAVVDPDDEAGQLSAPDSEPPF